MAAISRLDRVSPLDHQILQFEHLQILSRMKRISQVERWAESQGIAYRYDGTGGIWTTLDALNVALGLRVYEEPDRPYRPEEVL